ncbi:hypothetical protein KIPB_005664 [Kipferlia bialata]|uniref:Uncharacterized protein n=1 Tax=Kipferlia bialata TaxID=797122 RepID=A0A9K3CVR3_9EUKA|nr:hypothetical protein KIPB_005664 [Kipferlia bialata]|eukprot:g5664.t1
MRAHYAAHGGAEAYMMSPISEREGEGEGERERETTSAEAVVKGVAPDRWRLPELLTGDRDPCEAVLPFFAHTIPFQAPTCSQEKDALTRLLALCSDQRYGAFLVAELIRVCGTSIPYQDSISALGGMCTHAFDDVVPTRPSSMAARQGTGAGGERQRTPRRSDSLPIGVDASLSPDMVNGSGLLDSPRDMDTDPGATLAVYEEAIASTARSILTLSGADDPAVVYDVLTRLTPGLVVSLAHVPTLPRPYNSVCSVVVEMLEAFSSIPVYFAADAFVLALGSVSTDSLPYLLAQSVVLRLLAVLANSPVSQVPLAEVYVMIAAECLIPEAGPLPPASVSALLAML